MKLLISARTMTLCEHLLRRYEYLLLDGVLDAEPSFKAWVIEALAEVTSARHKDIAEIAEKIEDITPEALEESCV